MSQPAKASLVSASGSGADKPPGKELVQQVSWRFPTWAAVVTGALAAPLLTIPLAALTALAFRFPIPFVGYRSGLEHAPHAMFAAAFYVLVLGGWIILPLAGGLGGLFLGYRYADRSGSFRLVCTLIWALIVGSTGVVALSILDKIIGPW